MTASQHHQHHSHADQHGRCAATAGNLPPDSTPFVGRRRLLETTTPVLGSSRLVTLIGADGVGKTRAAIHLGRHAARTAPGGVWLVDLATVDDPALVPSAVAAALGVRDQSQRPVLDTIVRHVGERDRPLLLLDNCEHLSAAVAELADALLRHTADTRILATSRQPIGVPGEHVVRVRPMIVPTRAELRPGTSLDSLAHYDAVRLFVDRAAAAGVELSDRDGADVGRLVRALEGVPLSIELAAARTATMTVTDIAARLAADPLRALTGNCRITHPCHHRDLDATLAWSYQLCTPAEQHLWARLAVFTGGFDLAAAEAVCADADLPAADILGLVEGLARQSLIAVHHDTDASRYRMLETVRAYGLAKLTERGEDTDIRARHRRYYRNVTDTLVRAWFGPHERAWMARVRRELPDIRAALRSAVATGDTETGLITAVNLSRSRVWFLAGTLPEARYWLRTLLAQQPDTPLRLLVLTNGAWITACQGEQGSALSIVADCLRAARATGGNDLAAAMVAFARGSYRMFCGGDLNTAAADFTRARDGLLRAEQCSDAHMAHLCLAICTAAGPDATAAFRAAEDCLTDADTAGARWAASWAQWAYGLAHLRHGDPRRALTVFRAGLHTQQATADSWGTAWSLAALGWTAATQGDHHQAAVLQGAATRQYDTIGIQPTGARLLTRLGADAEATTQTALGVDAYTRAHHHGATLDHDTTIATALGEHTRTAHPTKPAARHRRPTDLTDREHDVVRLLAADASLTNKAMANRLCISVRTIDTHMNHIARKLGVTTRAQIAVWANTHTV